MSQTYDDETYMRRCLQIAACGIYGARPNPMVGAVIVAPGGRIIGEGYHVRCGEGHAEVNAFASVKPTDEPLLRQSTMYVSLEPCAHYGKTPPCADLIVAKGVRRVVVGCVDPFAKVEGRGIRKLREAGIEVAVGVLEEECRALNRRFITFQTLGRPYIILKWAQSADGYIDRDSRPTMISTPFTQMLAHKLRAECQAIVVGRVTAERDRPRLDTRRWGGPAPRRFVLSRSHGLDDVVAECRSEGLQSLLVEGGAATHRAFIDAGLWDEIRVETSPETFGRGTKAAGIPAGARLASHEAYDGNSIDTYKAPLRLSPAGRGIDGGCAATGDAAERSTT